MSDIVITIVDSVTCPNGHEEIDPATAHLPVLQRKFQIRAFKVLIDEERGWESECLVCGRWFGQNGKWEGEA